MTTTIETTAEEIRDVGIEALTQALGIPGMIRFFQIFSNGQGDYTTERYELLESATIPEIVAEIKRIRKAGGIPREGLADRSKHGE